MSPSVLLFLLFAGLLVPQEPARTEACRTFGSCAATEPGPTKQKVLLQVLAQPSAAVQLREFAARFDRSFLPPAQVVVP